MDSFDDNQIHDTDDLMADVDQGPSLAVQVSEANDAITDQLRLLAALEGEITDAMALPDVEGIVRLRATRDVLASLILAMRSDRDVLYAKHSDQVAREAREQREAEFAKLPERQTYTDPTDGQTAITIFRFKI